MSGKNGPSDTNLSLSNVAEEAGFTNAKHLALVFPQQPDTTPTAYRRNFRPVSQKHERFEGQVS